MFEMEAITRLKSNGDVRLFFLSSLKAFIALLIGTGTGLDRKESNNAAFGAFSFPNKELSVFRILNFIVSARL